jgi:hypothetical protein
MKCQEVGEKYVMKRFMMYTYSILVNDQISDDVGMV